MEVSDRKRRKKVTKSKFLDLILPVSGCVSYELFSVSIMNTSTCTKLLGWTQPIAAEVVWFNAHVGLGAYIYRLEIFHCAPVSRKVIYSAFVTAMFNFGSVLMWGTTKALLPKCPSWMRTTFGLGSGLALLYTGWHLIEYLNCQLYTGSSSSPNNNTHL